MNKIKVSVCISGFVCVHEYMSVFVCVCGCPSQIQLAGSDHTSHLVNGISNAQPGLGIRYLVQNL